MTACRIILAFILTGIASTAIAGEVGNCLGCHAESSDTPVHAVFFTPHGGGGTNNEACTSCHGVSLSHADNPIDSPPDLIFGRDQANEPAEQIAGCRSCHTDSAQMLWVGSVHDSEDISCTDCHTIHTQTDDALDRIAQSGVCFDCHTRVQSQVRLSSRHPILEGRTACIDCHNPHGSSTRAALIEPTLNDTCYTCHAEKRGPFLFEHQPVTEDCSLCHNPHGSVIKPLLTAHGPFLCQQCHSAAFHPSQLADGSGLPAGNPSPFLLGRNCMNCHSQVHGSNHPSGARMTR